MVRIFCTKEMYPLDQNFADPHTTADLSQSCLHGLETIHVKSREGESQYCMKEDSNLEGPYFTSTQNGNSTYFPLETYTFVFGPLLHNYSDLPQ